MELMGGCLCDAVRFSVTAEPFAAYYCHCAMCQKERGRVTEADNTRRRLKARVRKALESAEVALEDAR